MALALGIEYLTAEMLGNVDLFGFYLKFGEHAPSIWPDGWHEILILECGTLIYWLWRVILRLAVVAPAAPSATGESEASAATPSRLWPNLGTGFRRVLRLAIVWPALAALTVLIFTPWLEAYLRMPGVPEIPADDDAPNALDKLVAFPSSLDWSMTPNRWLNLNEATEVEQFYVANHERMQPLEAILAGPIHLPIDYSPKAPWLPEEQEESLDNVGTAVSVIHSGALRTGDAANQFRATKDAIQLSRLYRRNVILPAFDGSHYIAKRGMLKAYQSRDQFDSEQCQALIALLQSAMAEEDSEKDVDERTVN